MRVDKAARAPRRTRHSCTLIVITLLGFGCGGDSPATEDSTDSGGRTATTSAARSYSCDELLTVTEIDQAFGAPGTERTTAMTGEDEYAGRTQCAYSHPGNFILRVDVFSGRDQLEFFTDVRDQAQQRNPRPIEGHADGIIADAVGDGRQAVVRVNGTGVAISAVDMDGRGRIDVDRLIRDVLAIVAGRI